MEAENNTPPQGPFQLLHNLPSELVQEIIGYLTTRDLQAFNLASKWSSSLATPLLWREVVLLDRCTTHPNPIITDDGDPGYMPADRVPEVSDHHDETPLLRKLIALGKHPALAAHVQILEHRCHLPPPGIFNELPRTPLSGATMSLDPRTAALAQRAVAGMRRLHTLRLVFGHPALVDALLRSAFDVHRQRDNPVRRLWLEGVRVAGACDGWFPAHPAGLAERLDFAGLESVRFRRMPLRPAMGASEARPRYDFVHARGARVVSQVQQMQDGRGGLYDVTINGGNLELVSGMAESGWAVELFEASTEENLLRIFTDALKWDDEIYAALEAEVGLPNGLPDVSSLDYETRARMAWRGPVLDPSGIDDVPLQYHAHQRERLPSSRVALNLIGSASNTLTSLTLDWVLAQPANLAISLARTPAALTRWLETYAELFALRFPHLRAFQYRNAVTIDTLLPPGLFLLGRSRPRFRNVAADVHRAVPEILLRRLELAPLEFMEAHPKLQCLAWPMEAFFPAQHPSDDADIASRVAAVIDTLARSLLDLRVDTEYNPSGEHQTEDADPNFPCPNPAARAARRAFIARFAARMTRVQRVKIEGGMPRDERREILRALRACPVREVVLIGVCAPAGNTWGHGGADLPGEAAALDLDPDAAWALQAEDRDGVHRFAHADPSSPPDADADADFTPTYAWPPGSPPLLHALASLPFATTQLTRLKLCGWKGAPVLFHPTPLTSALLRPLRHLRALRELVLSVALLTGFEGQSRDAEVIAYWTDARGPETTALVPVRSAGAEMGAWERELETKFKPAALAGEVVRVVGPALSGEAKGRREGVGVRASMCLGDWGGIFDLDVHVGRDGEGRGGDVLLGFEGPREELEEGRRRGKLEGRRWF